jgi:hypothetical protein
MKKIFGLLILFLILIIPVLAMGNKPMVTSGGGEQMSSGASGFPLVADTWVYAFRPDRNYGDGGGWVDKTDPDNPVTTPKMFLGFGGTDIKIALIKFDTAALKKEAAVKSAVVSVYNDFAGSDAAQKIDAKQVLSDWDEMKVTYNTRPKIADEKLSTVTFQGAIGYNQPGKWYSFDVTPAIKAWQAGKSNYGIALVPQGDSGVDFDLIAREYATKRQFAPKLEIVYE